MLTSCSFIRGYMADGAYGPTSFSYEKQLKDTIVNRGDVFTFSRASAQCDWIDTCSLSRSLSRLYFAGSLWMKGILGASMTR